MRNPTNNRAFEHETVERGSNRDLRSDRSLRLPRKSSFEILLSIQAPFSDRRKQTTISTENRRKKLKSGAANRFPSEIELLQNHHEKNRREARAILSTNRAFLRETVESDSNRDLRSSHSPRSP